MGGTRGGSGVLWRGISVFGGGGGGDNDVKLPDQWWNKWRKEVFVVELMMMVAGMEKVVLVKPDIERAKITAWWKYRKRQSSAYCCFITIYGTCVCPLSVYLPFDPSILVSIVTFAVILVKIKWVYLLIITVNPAGITWIHNFNTHRLCVVIRNCQNHNLNNLVVTRWGEYREGSCLWWRRWRTWWRMKWRRGKRAENSGWYRGQWWRRQTLSSPQS